MPILAPDALVLAGGGTVGEAWMTGVLAGIEDATGIDFRRTEQIIGTSAGSIVAAWLAGGHRPRRPEQGDDGMPTMPPAAAEAESGFAAEPADDGRAGLLRGAARAVAERAWDATAPLASPALAVGAPGGAVARALLLSRVPPGGRSLRPLTDAVARRGARFDGRLRVVAVARSSGRRVVFGAPGAPPAPAADAVTASCAIPWVFRPVRIGDEDYVDGGVWSMTNLDVASVGRGSEVLCLSVVAGLPLALRSPLGALRAGARAAEAIETQALRRRGARVRTIGPDAGSARAIGGRLMDERRAPAALAAGYRQGLRVGAER